MLGIPTYFRFTLFKKITVFISRSFLLFFCHKNQNLLPIFFHQIAIAVARTNHYKINILRFSSHRSFLSSPQLGDLVAVEKNDEEDEKWVRGLVAEIKNNEYLCALIDYGVTQLCREVKQLPKKYIDIPNFTCLCKTDSESLKQIEAVLTTFFCCFSSTLTHLFCCSQEMALNTQ